MNEEVKQQILILYPEYDKLSIPFVRKDGRRTVSLRNSKTRKYNIRQYAKLLLEIKLNRRLVGDETVDHIDEDKLNDDPDNLQLLSRADNAAKSSRRRVPVKANCVFCNNEFSLSRNQLNSRAKTKAGPFCSRPCFGLYGQLVQTGGELLPKNTIQVTYTKGLQNS